MISSSVFKKFELLDKTEQIKNKDITGIITKCFPCKQHNLSFIHTTRNLDSKAGNSGV